MAFRCLRLFRSIRSSHINRHKVLVSSITLPEPDKLNKPKEFRTEDNLIYFEDPDKFGTLSSRVNTHKVLLEDEGDIQEDKLISELPLPSQKLTTRQYADLIKQYIKHKRLKEAINILEVKMIEEDRVKPENYIYNILIGACAEVGYTKKAFKLFNDMKRRGLKPTGDTYTCLFHACANSPWPSNGLKLATHLRELMIEKGDEPNLTNYNSMIKAFGRCGDVPTSFEIVDEMVSKGIKIRVHTFNHLLQACISDKEHGLRHALMVWRKMLKMREKPNIYSFNLMLKCVKDCNIGSQTDIENLIRDLNEHTALDSNKARMLQIESSKPLIEAIEKETNLKLLESTSLDPSNILNPDKTDILSSNTQMSVMDNQTISMELVNMPKKVEMKRTLPNLLSKVIQMEQVLSLQRVKTLQDKFAVIGGEEDFLKEMEVYGVNPDVKTITQMLPLIEESMEAEINLLNTIKTLDIRADISFYNMLIKKRCLRSEYDAAFDVMKMIKKEGRIRIRRFPDRKKLHLKPNIMTYGVLAMACTTKESAEKLLSEMKEAQLKVNIEILGTLLRQGTAHNSFGYVLYIMNLVKDENIQPNLIFLKHLEAFSEMCTVTLNREKGKGNCSEVFMKTFKIFSRAYKNWLKDINIDEILKPENPWAQFNETHPTTLQNENINIKQPKKFYKRSRKFVKYTV